MIDWKLALSLTVPAVVAVVGWLIGHQLAGARDRSNKRRELCVQHLIEAYRLLAEVSNRPFTAETHQALERAATEIQLFGSEPVIGLLHTWVDAYSKGEQGHTSPLVRALRDELRKELHLDHLADAPKALRISTDGEAA
jgi:hypothetical protein